MTLFLTSILVAIIGGYYAGYLLERPRLKSFWSNHPAISATAGGILLIAMAVAATVLYRLTGQTLTVLHIQLLVYSSLYIFAVVVPVSIILKRLGFRPWWATIALIPLGQIVGLWIVALKRWPIRGEIDRDVEGSRPSTINHGGARDEANSGVVPEP